ncbi:MAG: sugar transferase [Candidatus Aminicenantes bacterium]|nr:sugar transferase [Candidatus Aminicenantes bacterium]
MKKLNINYTKGILILIGDIFIIPLSYLAAYKLRLLFGALIPFREIAPSVFLFVGTMGYLCIFYFFGLYELKKYFSFNTFIKILLSVLTASILISILKYGLFFFPIGRGILFIANIIIFILVFGWRLLIYKLSKYIIAPKKVIIVGKGKAVHEILQAIKLVSEDLDVIGTVQEKEGIPEKSTSSPKSEVLGSIDKLQDIIQEYGIDQIVLAGIGEKDGNIAHVILEARLKGIIVIDMPDLYQTLLKKIPINYVQEKWFIHAKGFERINNFLVIKVKRLIDAISSCLILLISLPLWPFIALMIKLNSPGPIFYKQRRLGKNESTFFLYKFRSMIHEAEKNGAVWAEQDDDRITGAGKIMRRLHVDELPQLINVIKGDMSLVGPRPERPEFVEDLKKEIPFYSLRHFTMPGMTGWAQISYPYAASLKDAKEKLEYDLYYISHMNLLLDMRILLKTVQIVVFGRKKVWR